MWLKPLAVVGTKNLCVSVIDHRVWGSGQVLGRPNGLETEHRSIYATRSRLSSAIESVRYCRER